MGRVYGGCRKVVFRMWGQLSGGFFGSCLEDKIRMSPRCGEALSKVSLGCLEDLRRLS